MNKPGERTFPARSEELSTFDHQFHQMGFFRLIRFAREQAELSQFHLAERMDSTQSWISRLERGRRLPHVYTLARIMAACGMRMWITVENPSNKRQLTIEFDGYNYRRWREDLKVADRMERSAQRLRDLHARRQAMFEEWER